ncbi:S-type anion channel SLAH1-like [Euphorbia lathyris]|uniref:S-type anion channel SLAH1-like n=1 Tax=Euphorbia lathyris TaxID=212925 RepID=UPI0033134947
MYINLPSFHSYYSMDSNSNSEIVIEESPQEQHPLKRFDAGYFRISLSFCSQSLLFQILNHQSILPSTPFLLLWLISLFTITSLSLFYTLRSFFHFQLLKSDFLHPVGVNYLFAPWISWLLLLQSSPFLFLTPYYPLLCCLFLLPILLLDLKIYGQWFIKGKRSLSTAANPTTQLSVIGNLVGARTAALMGWKETSICLFSLGITHYLVLFVTLYQRLSPGNCLPTMLRPAFFLFIATPSVACLAWNSISGTFDNFAKMLFFLSLFLFLSLVSRPKLFHKSTRKFNVAWWAYSFPLTLLALASAYYAQEVKAALAHGLMLLLSSISLLVSLSLIFFTANPFSIFHKN